MQQGERRLAHLTLARTAGHLMMRFHQMRHRAATAAVPIGKQAAVQVERQNAIFVEVAISSARTGLSTRREADLLEQDGKRDGEAVVDGRVADACQIDASLMSRTLDRSFGSELSEARRRADVLMRMRLSSADDPHAKGIG